MYQTTTNVDTARRLLGIGKNTAYEQVRAGTFPGLIPLGGTRHRVSLFALAERLGCTIDDVRAMIPERDVRSAEPLSAA
jgi:hypothetical protein